MNRVQNIFILVALYILSSCQGFVVVPSQRQHRHHLAGLFLSSEEEGASAATTPQGDDKGEPKPQVKCPDCDLCDGSGRILGGLGAVLPWIPIKAYRPCPNFVDRGGFYERSGQGLDEIAFGRDSSFKKNG